MPLFPKKKNKKTIANSAQDLKGTIEGEVLPAALGLTPSELERLLKLLGDKKRPVFQRKAGGFRDKENGVAYWKKPKRLSYEKAMKLLHEEAEEYAEREREFLRKKRKLNPNYQISRDVELDESGFSENLTADDVLLALKTAKKRLTKPETPSPKSTAEESHMRWIFVALEQLKKEEKIRFAREIASLQQKHIEGKTAERQSDLETETRDDAFGEQGIGEESEKIQTLDGFGSKPLMTLIDEAGSVVEEDLDAAAKVVRQWIGNQTE
ncbi:MAG: hypothetical protein LBT05_00455 [Planctomycetaceae bacterium]|jgi:hypothetical protein|nr:hypothetical protein [Planctomycetaceae bacterium]